MTLPCEMRSGSSSRGLRGPLPFVRGHFGTAQRHRRAPASPPAVPAHANSPSGTIPAILVPSSGTCTNHTAECPSGRGRRDPGQSRPAHRAMEDSQRALLKRSSGQCWSLTETPRAAGQPRSPGDTARRDPELQLPPPRDSAFSPGAVPSVPGCSKCAGCTLCPRCKLCLQPELCPAWEGRCARDSTLVTSERTQME